MRKRRGAGAPARRGTLARDEAFWRRFRAGYAFPRGEVNLDHAAGSPTSRRVSDALATRANCPRGAARTRRAPAVAVDGLPSVELAARLAEQGFVVQNKGKRGSPFPGGVRVSPHGYTSPAEIDRFADALRRLAR